MNIIPAIDIINGQCVRLTQGDYGRKKVYHRSPLSVAQSFEEAGAKHLHLVDLDAAKSGQFANHDLVRAICQKTNLSVDYGGGIRSTEQIDKVFEAGVRQVNIGSLSVKKPELVKELLSIYGTDRIILSADVKDRRLALHGWQEVSEIGVEEYIRDYLHAGAKYFVCTDISKDGALSGSSIALYEELMAHFPEMQLIASGGVQSIEEVQLLRRRGLYGVIIGKAIYESKISLDQLFA